MKKYIIFAGVNGAGKTTLYQTNDELYNMPRINIDEIVREFGSWNNQADVISAGKIAVSRIREYFKNSALETVDMAFRRKISREGILNRYKT